MPSSGFWSYVHADDEAEGHRIHDLADDVMRQYEALTTDHLEIFFDRKSLNWGDDWERKIEEAILSTAFFVPILSPRYLSSEACRREFRLFAQKAEEIGERDLVLPIVWYQVPELDEVNPTDDLVAIVKRFQWEDWRDLRFEERTSSTYRRAVHSLAERLVSASTREVNSSTPTAVSDTRSPREFATRPAATPEEDDQDEPGVLDVLVESEEAMAAWTQTVNDAREEIEAVGNLASAATEEMAEADRRGQGLAGRLTASKRLAAALAPHSQRIEELGNKFATELYAVDAGMRHRLTMATEATEPSDIEAGRDFLSTIRQMAASSRSGLGSIQGMADSIAPVERMSRDLKPPLRQIRKGLTVMIEGQRIIDDWDRIAANGLALEPVESDQEKEDPQL